MCGGLLRRHTAPSQRVRTQVESREAHAQPNVPPVTYLLYTLKHFLVCACRRQVAPQGALAGGAAEGPWALTFE